MDGNHRTICGSDAGLFLLLLSCSGFLTCEGPDVPIARVKTVVGDSKCLLPPAVRSAIASRIVELKYRRNPRPYPYIGRSTTPKRRTVHRAAGGAVSCPRFQRSFWGPPTAMDPTEGLSPVPWTYSPTLIHALAHLT